MAHPLGFLLYDTARLFRRALDEGVRGGAATGLQMRLLGYLSRHEGINQGALAGLIEVEPITLSRMVDRLAEAGLVERRADPADRRAWRLYLTPAAHPALAELRAAAGAVAEDALAGLSADERVTLERLLGTIRSNLSRKDNDSDRQLGPALARSA